MDRPEEANIYNVAELRRARRHCLAAADAIEPYSQGELDGLCGLYAAVNALRLIAAGRQTPFSDDDVMTLFRHGASFLDRNGKLSAAVRYGTRWRLWIKLVDELRVKASRMLRGKIELTQPFGNLDDLAKAVFVSTVCGALAEGRAVLLFIKCDEDHFSVVSGIGVKKLRLFDSYGYDRIALSKCATEGQLGSRPYHIRVRSMLMIGP